VRPAAAAALVLVLVPAAGLAQKKDDVGAEQRKLQQTQRELREQRAKAAEARKKESSLLAELEEIDRTLAEKRAEVTRLDDRIARTQAEIGGLRGDIRRLEGRKAVEQQVLATRLRSMYKIQAQGGALPLVLGGQDPVERVMLLRHLTTLATVDARLIQEYLVTSTGLSERKAREEARRAELESLRREAERGRAEMDLEATRRRGLLAKVRDERAYHERMVGELTEASRRSSRASRSGSGGRPGPRRRPSPEPPPAGSRPCGASCPGQPKGASSAPTGPRSTRGSARGRSGTASTSRRARGPRSRPSMPARLSTRDGSRGTGT